VAESQRAALYSTVHGAGRVMSRTQAAGKRNRRTGEVISPGRVSPEMMREWVTSKGVVLRGGGLDESPHVYRRLPDVLAAQKLSAISYQLSAISYQLSAIGSNWPGTEVAAVCRYAVGSDS
jgi:RNA-splicing ligase RtcB